MNRTSATITRNDFDIGLYNYSLKHYTNAFIHFGKASTNGNPDATYKLGFMYHHGLGIPSDYDKAISYYLKSSTPDSKAMIGWMYLDGQGVEQNDEKAMEWFMKSKTSLYSITGIGFLHSKQQKFSEAMACYLKAPSCSIAQMFIGDLFYYGNGVKQDYMEALDWYLKASDDEPKALYRIGELYLNGKGVNKDYTIAYELMKKAATFGVLEAQYNLGLLYHSGNGTFKDQTKAFQWFMISSKHPISQLYVAMYYEHGIFKGNAFEWYMKSANQGNANAQYWIGKYFNTGKGGMYDYDAAYDWFLKAAVQNDSHAQLDLALLYHNGNGVVQDYQFALEWLHKAAANGNPEAYSWIGYYYENGYLVQNYEQAIDWYVKGSELGNSNCQTRLAILYNDGKGTTKNYRKAFNLFVGASNQKNPIALGYLGLYYLEGRHVPADEKRGLEYIEQAKLLGFELPVKTIKNSKWKDVKKLLPLFKRK